MSRGQYLTLKAIQKYIKERGISPRITDIAKELNNSDQRVRYNILKLQEYGFIKYENKRIKLLKDFNISYE